MLEQVFGSKTRVRLLSVFLNHPSKNFYVRELTRRINSQVHAVRRELDNLTRCGFISEIPEETINDSPPDVSISRGAQKKFFRANTDSLLYPELKALFLKAQVLVGNELVQKIEKAGKISVLILCGAFLGLKDSPTDILAVGSLNKRRLAKIFEQVEKEIGFELRYTVMSRREFQYRREVTDRFLYSILEQKHAVVMDKVSKNT